MNFVLGGVRSGKSRFAEQLAARLPPLTYLATARAGDAEMARRIALHQERRAGQPDAWRTIEEPVDVAAVLAQHREGSLLLECLPLWLGNLLAEQPDDAIRQAVQKLCQAICQASARVVVVSSEVGLGFLPENALARRFGDLLGEANQQLAEQAAEVYWCMAGIPVCIKPHKGLER